MVVVVGCAEQCTRSSFSLALMNDWVYACANVCWPRWCLSVCECYWNRHNSDCYRKGTHTQIFAHCLCEEIEFNFLDFFCKDHTIWCHQHFVCLWTIKLLFSCRIDFSTQFIWGWVIRSKNKTENKRVVSGKHQA